MIPRLKPALTWQELWAAFTPPHSDEIERFEQAFASEMGQQHGIAFPYGRTGLMLLLEALDLRGKEVICPAYTCVVVPHAIVKSGNLPVFVDSQDYDFNMDLDQVLDAITDKTRAIIATSIFGYPVDLDKLDQIRKLFPNIYIIQDCAHSFAAEWNGRPVNQSANAAIFGLNISKLITSIFGGMVTTDDDELAARLRWFKGIRLRAPHWLKAWRRRLYFAAVYPAFWEPVYGLVNWLEHRRLLDQFVKYYDDSQIDMPSDFLEGLTRVEARVGIRQIKKYQTIVKHRRSLAEIYNQELGETPNLRLPPLITGATYSHYVPRVPYKQETVNFILRKGIQLGELIEYCIPSMRAYQNLLGSRRGYINASQMAKTTINLPLHVSATMAENIANHLKDAMNHFNYRNHNDPN